MPIARKRKQQKNKQKQKNKEKQRQKHICKMEEELIKTIQSEGLTYSEVMAAMHAAFAQFNKEKQKQKPEPHKYSASTAIENAVVRIDRGEASEHDSVFVCDNNNKKTIQKKKMIEFLAITVAINQLVKCSADVDVEFKGNEGAYLNHMNLIQKLYDSFIGNKDFVKVVNTIVDAAKNMYEPKEFAALQVAIETRVEELLIEEDEEQVALNAWKFWNTIETKYDRMDIWYKHFVKLRIHNNILIVALV